MKIPGAEDFGRQVARAPSMQGTISPRAFGQDIAEGVATVGQAYAQDEELRFRKETAERQRLAAEVDTQVVFESRRKLDEWQRNTVFDPKTGAITRLGKDALSLPDELPKAFDEFAAEVGKGLATTRQQQAFQEMALARRNEIASWADRHAGTQRDVYERGQFEADLESTALRAAQFATDPARVKAELAISAERIVGFYSAKGLSVEQTNAKIREQANAVHAGVLDTLLAGDDWQAAGKYLNANAEQMEPATVLRLRRDLDKQTALIEGTRRAREAVGSMLRSPSDMDNVIAITMQSESGGRRYGANGELLTSPAGAKGEMQVMDGTNLSPGFGVKPAKDDSPDERARVGRDYMAAMVKRYGGDLTKAWAAYNAGPGRVDQEVKDAEKRGQPDAWLSNMPSETRAYVQKNVTAYDAGVGKPARPTLSDVLDRVRAVTPDPEQQRVAVTEAARLYREETDAIKQREDETEAEAMRQLQANGGSYAALPREVRNNLSPSAARTLMDFADKLAKGKEPETNAAVFLKLTDDNYLKGLSDNEFYKLRAVLSPSDWESFAKQRQAKKSPLADKSAELPSGAVSSTLNARLASIGIDPTPAQRDKAGQAQVATIQRYVRDNLLRAQAQAGRQFNDVEVAQHIDKIFATTTDLPGGIFSSAKTVRRITMEADDIPRNIRKTLEEDFAAAGIEPSDGELLDAYWNLLDMRKP